MKTATAALEALEQVEYLAAIGQADPLAYMEWLPPQWAWLHSTAKRQLCRTGNQWSGKTWAGLAETIYRCRGRHPFKEVPRGPISAWLICASWSESLAVQKKLWSLLPRGEIDPITWSDTTTADTFDEKNGFGSKSPVIKWLNGSTIHIKTAGQHGLNLSSATIDFAMIDEPLKHPRLYGEIERRLTRTGGTLWHTLTPINADCTWLEKHANEGKITDMRFKLTPENCIPVGKTLPMRTKDGRPMDAAWIAEQRANVLSYEEGVVLDGDWEMRAIGRAFENFDSGRHAIYRLQQSAVRPSGECYFALGMDYGEESLRTIGVLVAVNITGEHMRVWVLGEYAPEQATTEDMDAKGIVNMLAAAGLEWSDLDYAHGDKRYTDAKGRVTKKSNATMLAALERELNVRRGLRPKILGAKRGEGAGAGAKWLAIRKINEAMLRASNFYIDRDCAWGLACLDKWKGGDSEIYKDWCDALRYALKPFIIDRRGRSEGSKPIRIRIG